MLCSDFTVGSGRNSHGQRVGYFMQGDRTASQVSHSSPGLSTVFQLRCDMIITLSNEGKI